MMMLALGTYPLRALATMSTPAEVCNLDASDPQKILSGKNVNIGLYSGELASYNPTTGVWSGYDVELLDRLAQLGDFTYTIVNIGDASEIDNYSEQAMKALGYGK